MITTDGDLDGRTLVCRVRAMRVALPLKDVVETMRPLRVEPFSGAPPFVCGLSVIRGVPTPVVDLGTLLGSDERARPTRFVTLRVGERRVALAVEGVEGVRDFPRQGAHELPPLLKDASVGLVAAVRTLDAELMLVLSAAKIISEQTWSMLAEGDDTP
jgi:purine-binding chemotaxis protein CheW